MGLMMIPSAQNAICQLRVWAGRRPVRYTTFYGCPHRRYPA
jgi:hypothetical protein